MEANKEEGQKCIDVAKSALTKGDVEKAKRFAQKAKRLGGTTLDAQVESLWKQIDRAEREGTRGQGRSGIHTPTSDNVRNRSASNRSTDTSTSTETEGTVEQRKLVNRINTSTDYYAILGIAKTSTEDEIKKAYRKLALKLHPDKCRVRGAEDAFKGVSRAFSCLSDPDKRSSYDRYGRERQAGSGFGGASGFHRGEELDPEELFNMFFGGTPMGNVYRRYGDHRFHRGTPPQQRQQQPEQFNLAALIQLAPIIFLIIFTMFGSAPQDRIYSIHKHGKYNVLQTTADKGLEFFVKPNTNFVREYPKGTYKRRKLEVMVERDHREHLENQCYRERVIKHQQSGFGKHSKNSHPLDACKKIQEIWGGSYQYQY